MAINLLMAVQERLKLPEIIKVIPDSQDAVADDKPAVITMSQVATVCVTAALYKITRTPEGCVKLLLAGKKDNWLSLEEAYGERLPEVYERVAAYGIADDRAVACLLKDIANTCLLIIHETLTDKISTETVKDFMSDQRHNILMYKPIELGLGKILNDSVLDDQTNKMEGPVSNMMHNIENLFS